MPCIIFKPLPILGSLVLVLLISGCGTLASRFTYDPYEYKVALNPSVTKKMTSTIYGGLAWHSGAIKHCYGPYKISDACAHQREIGFIFIWWLIVEGFASFDHLFLSSLTDTLILPLTIYETCCTGELSLAAAQGDLPLVQQLLEEGTDINDTDAWGHTPLMSASWAGQMPVVRVLLERGADVNSTTSDDWTALRFAKAQGHPDVVAVLKAAGAKS